MKEVKSFRQVLVEWSEGRNAYTSPKHRAHAVSNGTGLYLSYLTTHPVLYHDNPDITTLAAVRAHSGTLLVKKQHAHVLEMYLPDAPKVIERELSLVPVEEGPYSDLYEFCDDVGF